MIKKSLILLMKAIPSTETVTTRMYRRLSLLFAVGLETDTLPTPCARRITTTATASGPPSIHGTDSMLLSCTSAQRAARYATEKGSIRAVSFSRVESGSTWRILASTATVFDNLPPDPRNPQFRASVGIHGLAIGTRATTESWINYRSLTHP